MLISAVLLLALQAADIDAAVAKGLKIDVDGRAKAEAKGRDRKELLDSLLDPKVFAEGVRRIDAKLGLWAGTFEITVGFGSAGGMPAWSDGGGGRGRIELDVDVLVAYAKKARDCAKQVKAGASFIVPPARLEAIIYHELTHCFLQGALADWLNEGACTYVAADPHFVAYFRNDKRPVRDIDAALEHKYAYGRGWAFLEWMAAKQGAAKLKAFIAAAAKKPAAEAASCACGLDWTKIKEEERTWSERWIATLPAE